MYLGFNPQIEISACSLQIKLKYFFPNHQRTRNNLCWDVYIPGTNINDILL